jgi:hypothetical protein
LRALLEEVIVTVDRPGHPSRNSGQSCVR